MISSSIRKPLLVVMMLLIASFSAGQLYQFQSMVEIDGFPNETTTDCIQDEDGNLWLATHNGIFKYDGYTIQNFSDSIGFRAVTEDNRGYIWVGGESGTYCRIKDDEILSSVLESDKVITDIVEFPNGKILISTNGDGLFLINDPYAITIDNNDVQKLSTAPLHVYGLFPIDSNRIFMQTGQLQTYYLKEDSISTFQIPLEYFDINSVLIDTEKNIWIGTTLIGLLKIRPDGDYVHFPSDLFADTTSFYWISSLEEDIYGNIWVGTWGEGVTRISKNGEFTKFKIENGLPSNKIWSILEDRDGDILIGALKGFTIYKSDQFLLYPSMKFVTGGTARTEFVNKNTFFVGNRNELYEAKFSDSLKLCQIFTPPNKYHEISDIHYDECGNLYIVTPPYLYIMQKGHSGFEIVKSFRCDIFSFGENLNCTTLDGIFYWGSDGGFFSYDIVSDSIFDLSKLKTDLNLDIDFHLDEITAFENCSGHLLIATDQNALYSYNKNSFRKIISELPTRVTSIRQIGDTIWLGTQYRGLYSFNLRDKSLSKVDILPSSRSIHFLEVSDQGLIIGTNNGLFHLVNDTLMQFNEDEGLSQKYIFPGSADIDPEGNVWFITNRGINRYSPNYNLYKKNGPEVFITGVKINSFQVPLHEEYRLKYSENDIEIGFDALSYTNRNNIEYSTKLSGYEHTFKLSKLKARRYYQLPPGEYDFQIIGINNFGVASKESASFYFRILPPWYKTKLAYGSYIILLLLVAYHTIKFRERKNRKEKARLEALVTIRTKEIYEQKEEILAQRDEIEAQRDLLVLQKDLVLSQKQELTDSINYALRIQQAVLPSNEYLSNVLPEYFVLFKPRDIVSGDFYWIKEIKNYLIIVAADCTGHGVPGAFMSMLGIAFLNEQIGKGRFDNPGEILNQLRIKVKETLAQKGRSHEQKDGMDMALAIIDKESKQLQYAGAFNPLYVVREKMKQKANDLEEFKSIDYENYQLFEIKGDRQPIGIHYKEIEFTSMQIQLEIDDSIYLFSDGFADQFGGPKRKKFLSKNFKKTLLQIQTLQMEEQKKYLDETFENWSAGFEQVDDILVMGIKI